MSIYDKASLIQIPSGYKAGKLYSVIPNSGAGDFTVTGDAEGDATRVNSQGLIETVNANVPRLDYPFIDGVVQDCPRLLLEPQRTNYAPYSEDFNNWGDIGTTITPNAIISPNGTLNASKLVSTANNWRKSSSFTASSGVEYTVSIYAKLDTSTSTTTTRLEVYNGAGSLAANYNLSNETISNSGFTSVFIERLKDDWYRIGGTYTAGGTNNILYVYPSAGYGTAGTMYFWGAQQEAGTYPTSYISTNGNSVTRLKDTCLNAGNSNLFNDSEGTLFLDVYDFKSSANPEITLSSGFATNRITLVYYPSSNQLRFYISSNNVVQADQFVSYTYSQRNKIALRYKQNDFKAYINGTQVFSDTSGNTPIALSRFDFSKYDQTNGFFEGEVYQTMIFNEALSDSELQTLTTL
jgi:hypothetical protein